MNTGTGKDLITNGKINGPDDAAEPLGITPRTFHNQMKKMGIVQGRKSAD